MQLTIILFILSLTCLPLHLDAQDRRTFKKDFLEAEYFFLLEEYEEAAFLYKELINAYPINANLHFLLGACYLSMEGKKTLAIPHLERAVTSMSAGYREGSYREINAPRIALFALARAYHINHQFDKSIEYYERYKNVMRISDVAEVNYVNKQIASVKLAKEFIRDTIDVNYLVLCEAFHAINQNYRAVFAERDSMVIFMSDMPFFSAIITSRISNGTWSAPDIINEQLQIDGRYKLSSVSYDGMELYLTAKLDESWDLYVSYFVNDRWSPVQPLKSLNTKYNETHASLTRDKQKIFFTSDRPGGIGIMDIYFAERDPQGEWGIPINIGRPINSYYSEETPFISADGRTLYFSSSGHATMGGFDVFHSNLLPNDRWSYPSNLGFPLNTPDDNLFFVPIGNGNQALYSSEGGLLPERRILVLNLDEPKDEWKQAFRGTVLTQDMLELDSTAVIYIVDAERNEPVATITPSAETGEFEIDIPPGTYQLTFEAEGYEQSSEFVTILPRRTSGSIEMETSLTPSRVSSGEYALSRSVLYDFDSYELSETARFELEKLYLLLAENPYLYVEVTGYTDAIGSAEYNLRLAQRRSAAIINYLVSKGIPRENFISRAAGKTGFVAMNINVDGSDNPEGRRFNRRAEINLVNTGEGDIVLSDIYIPEHLKPERTRHYYVIIDEKESLQKNIPSRLIRQDIKLYETGRKYIYAAGSFNNRLEAVTFLNEVIDIDFPDSRIVTGNELNYLLKPSVPDLSEVSGPFTIQLMALNVPVHSGYFKLADAVRQIDGEDGIHRYITGRYVFYEDAQEDLANLVKRGFTDAYINQLGRYEILSAETDNTGFYTIQFSALRNPVTAEYFSGIEDVVMNRGADGFYRYTSGLFINRSDAEKNLQRIREMGFVDAFVRRTMVYSPTAH